VASGGAIAPELDIVRGRFDAAVDAFGELMKSYARLTFLVRVDYEVSPDMHCAPTDESDCPAYVNAFRYLRERWQRTEVKNVALVFHPTRGWAKQMYPGADLTDWIGFSVFNHDVCLTTPEGANGGCADGAHLDAGLAADFAWAAEQGKPILIAESTVQKPSDESAEGFNEYLTRLFELVNEHPQVRGLTYINMKWAGGFIYGEDWTQGAFGNVDSRLTHFPETRSYFCRTLGGRYLGLGGKPLACDDPDLKPLPLPPDLDAPVHERLVFLGNNRCVGAMGTAASGGDALVQGDCGTLGSNGQGRFRILERAGSAKIWSDRSWQCWSAEGEGLLQRPCADAVSQSFVLEPVSGAGSARDVRVRASSGACVAAAVDAPADAPLIVAPCNGSSFEVLRL
jgi:hypothetical protein